MRLKALLFALFALIPPLAAEQAKGGFQTAATEAILIDTESGAVLFEKNADTLFAPASMSKMMTLYVLFKKLKAGEISLETEFPVSLHAWKTGGAPSRTQSMFIPLNQSAKVAELIQGITVQNANDACIAVAEGLAGSEDAFAIAMTEEARALGLTKSTFGNATGLPDPRNLTTARELALLATRLIADFPNYYTYFAQKEFKYRTHDFKNINPLLNATLAVDGLKLGYAEGAGYGMTASATKDGHRLVAVLNGLPSDRERREEMLKFLSWGFVSFKSYTVFNEDEVVGDARVWGGQSSTVPVKTKSAVKILLPLTAKDLRLRAKIVYAGPLKPPVKEGDRVGELRVYSESAGTSNIAPLYAAADVQPGGMISQGIDSLLLGVNAYVSDAVTRLLKKAPAPQPPATAHGPMPTARL